MGFYIFIYHTCLTFTYLVKDKDLVDIASMCILAIWSSFQGNSRNNDRKYRMRLKMNLYANCKEWGFGDIKC